MRGRLTRAERETVIRTDEEAGFWDVYTCSPSMARKLLKLSIRIGVPAEETDSGYRFRFPMAAISFRVPRKATAAQREHLAKTRRQARAKRKEEGLSEQE